MAAYEVRTRRATELGLPLLVATHRLPASRTYATAARSGSWSARVADCLARSTNKRASLEIVHPHVLHAVDRLAADLM